MSTFGIVLLLIGVALAAAEAHVPSHGVLGGTPRSPPGPGSPWSSPAPG